MPSTRCTNWTIVGGLLLKPHKRYKCRVSQGMRIFLLLWASSWCPNWVHTPIEVSVAVLASLFNVGWMKTSCQCQDTWWAPMRCRFRVFSGGERIDGVLVSYESLGLGEVETQTVSCQCATKNVLWTTRSYQREIWWASNGLSPAKETNQILVGKIAARDCRIGLDVSFSCRNLQLQISHDAGIPPKTVYLGLRFFFRASWKICWCDVTLLTYLEKVGVCEKKR